MASSMRSLQTSLLRASHTRLFSPPCRRRVAGISSASRPRPLVSRRLDPRPRAASSSPESGLLGLGEDGDGDGDEDAYAMAVIKAFADGNTRLSMRRMSIQKILAEIPGMHARDFVSLSPTSLGDAASRRRTAAARRRSGDGIHPWFITPRESGIVMAFGPVRAVIDRERAFMFDAHKPTIRQQAALMSEQLARRDGLALSDRGRGRPTHFEVDVVEEVLSSVCTMYRRRVRLYEPIVGSLLARAADEPFSPSGLHRLAPVKDSLRRFEMNARAALACVTDLLGSDEDMLGLLLTEGAAARSEGRALPAERHEVVELLLEEYARRLGSIILEIDYMLQRVQSKQDMLALSLDAYRNRVISVNLYLAIGGISLAFGTTVAGFFGMNVVNGWEQAEGVFEALVMGSCFVGGGFLGGCYSYLNGHSMKARTLNNLNEIEIMNRALGDMSALDYSFELMLNEKEPLTREKFREKIYASEPEGIRDTEVNFLFDLLDYSKNDVIDKGDFCKS